MIGKIRVLVVDDSALMRKLLATMLQSDAAIEVVGTAMDGDFALRKIEELRPHVVTLDLDMPKKNGIETLREIMKRGPLPVIVVSALSTDGALVTMKALALGAFDFVTKPRDATAHIAEASAELIAKVKAAAECKIRPHLARTAPVTFPKRAVRVHPTHVVAIGISTGGPQALEYMLAQIPADFPGTILVVQHMPEGFTEMFARRLNELCAVTVREARSGDALLAGQVLICPGNRHMKVKRLALGDVVVLSEDERVNGHRPSADVLLNSVAEEFGSRAIGAVMTGMGTDGAEGLGEIKRRGGMTVAQDEESSVVFGMPKAAIERGYANRVVGLDRMSATLQAACLSGNAPDRGDGGNKAGKAAGR